MFFSFSGDAGEIDHRMLFLALCYVSMVRLSNRLTYTSDKYILNLKIYVFYRRLSIYMLQIAYEYMRYNLSHLFMLAINCKFSKYH